MSNNDASSSIADAMRCPICTDFPEDEVFQCHNGHSICKKCSENLEHCPQCRVSYKEGMVRNRLLENLLQTVEVDCPKKDSGLGFGCDEKVKLKDVGSHLKTCPSSKSQTNNTNLLRLCKLLGYSNCEFFIDMTSTSEDTQNIQDHFVQKHQGVLKFGRSVSVNFANFRDRIGRAARHGSIWSPIIINPDGSPKGPTLLVCATLHPDDPNNLNLSWIGILLSGGHKAGENSSDSVKSKFDLRIQMSGPSSLSEDVYWTFPTLHVSQDLWFKIKARPFRTPVDFLAQCIPRHNDFLQLKLGIIPKVAERPMLMSENPITINSGLQEILWSFDTDAIAPSSLALRTPTPGPGQSSESGASVSVGNRSRRGSGSPSESYSEESDSDSDDEELWLCDWCSRVLLEYPRYACLQCLGDDFIMCERCYNGGDFGVHNEHVFALIDNDAKMKRVHDNATAFTLPPSPPVLPDICKSSNLPSCHHPCHQHNNSGPVTHYVCIECDDEPCRFCGNCYYRDRINGVHNLVHILAVTDTDERAESIEYLFYTEQLPKRD